MAVTVTSAHPAQVGVISSPGPDQICLVFDASLRNISTQGQSASESDFDLYQPGSPDQPFSPCTLENATPFDGRPVQPGATAEGQFAFGVPVSAQRFWLAFTLDGPDDARTVWDIAVGPAGPSSASYHQMGETVKVQGMWAVTVNSAHPAAIGLVVPPQDSSLCLDVDVSLRNLSSESLMLNRDQFSLNDTRGNMLPYPCDDLPLRDLTGSIAAGALARGDVITEVPASEHEFHLSFQATGDCYEQCAAPDIWDITVSPTNTSGYHHPGEMVNVQGRWLVTLTNLRVSQNGVLNPPKPGDTCLFVQAAVKNISGEELVLIYDQFALYDTQGVQLSFCSLEHGLDVSDLSPGDVAQGPLAFEVPTSESQFRLVFEAISGAARQTARSRTSGRSALGRASEAPTCSDLTGSYTPAPCKTPLCTPNTPPCRQKSRC